MMSAASHTPTCSYQTGIKMSTCSCGALNRHKDAASSAPLEAAVVGLKLAISVNYNVWPRGVLDWHMTCSTPLQASGTYDEVTR